MNILNKIWPWSRIKSLEESLELSHKQITTLSIQHEALKSFHADLKERHEEVSKEAEKHLNTSRRMALIMHLRGYDKFAVLVLMLFCWNCFGQAVVRNVISTNYLNPTFGAQIYATNINAADFFTPAGVWTIKEEWEQGSPPLWSEATSNGGTKSEQTGTASHPGIMASTTGINVAGGDGMFYGQTSPKIFYYDFDLVYWEWVVQLPNLSVNASDGFCVKVGTGDNSSFGTVNIPQNYVGFYYNDQTNADWIAVITQGGGTVFTLDTKLPVVANAWVNLGALVKTSGTTFYTNHVACGTIAQLAPGFGQEVTPTIQIQKITGTNSRQINMDLFWLFKKFSTTR
jgi:hypothetical protein